MAVKTSLLPLAPDQEIEAGVIEDARARQRRHRGIAAALIVAAALAAGVILGFAGGGGGSRAGRHSGGGGSAAGAAGHVSDQVPVAASLRLPPNIGQFGLLAPRVGWAVNGVGLFITRDGGRRWSRAKVPRLTGDIVAELYTTASPAPDALVLSFSSNAFTYDRACRAPGPAIGAGALAVSVDSGRSWRATSLPACHLASSLSFLGPMVGFALAHVSPTRQAIYETTDGARSWQRRGTVPLENSNGSVAFANRSDGFAVRFAPVALGASERGTLYRTTDGGRTWMSSDICRGTPGGRVTTRCQTPLFFGTDGVMPAVATNNATHTGRLLLYTTKNAGRSWSAHTVAAGQALNWYLRQAQPIPFSAPNARDLFVFLSGTLYKSLDGGRMWTRLPQPHLSSNTIVDFASAGYGWIQAGRRFEYTTDGGRHWKPIGRH